jgi:hypothetical protein
MNKLAKYKKYLIYTLIGSLIWASLVAVFSVLIGSFNNTTQKVIWVLVSVVVHALLSIALIDRDENSNDKYKLVINVFYLLLPLSLVTSILGIITVISTDLTGQLYSTYLIAIIVALHSNLLCLFKNASHLIKRLLKANIVVTCLTGALILPAVYLSDATKTLGVFYNRSLAAFGIVDTTLTVLIVVLYKLYIQHHPHAEDMLQLFKKDKGKTNILVWIVVIFVALNVLPMLIFGLASFVSRGN